jgi:hypothetical protein
LRANARAEFSFRALNDHFVNPLLPAVIQHRGAYIGHRNNESPRPSGTGAMTMATFNRYTVLAAAIAFACSAWAQQPPDQNQPDQYSAGQFQDASDQAAQNQIDPPSRVARVAYLSGDVSFAAAGENDWLQAQRNRPMVTGDKLYTNAGRAELQIGTSSIFIADRSNMDFLALNDQTAQMELTQGSISIDVRRLNSGETYEVDTPTLAFIADQVGSYRIDVDPNGRSTTVSVTRGSGDAVGEGGNRVRVDEGQRVVFNDSQLSDYQVADLRGGDGFDSYVKERVVRYERAPARHYVSEEVVGYEDLDDNGSWEDAPDYGHVWYPSGVASDWAPYHDGTWDWVEPYGWTWVDNSSWGFAPFHYGRWAYIGSRWGWVPGPVDVRPVYAPALVAFVGGDGFSVGISTGPIGWFALGPRDVYFPGYRCGRDYFNRINVSNTVVNNTVVNNYYGAFSSGHVNYAQINYANRSNPRAITAVPATTFASGRPVAASAIAVNRTTFANARVMPRAAVAPTAASLVANRGRATPPPAAVRNRTVVAANRPAPASVPFAQRQALLRQNPGQPLTTAQMRTVAARAPAARGGATVAVSTRPNVRLANPAGANAPVVNARANANARAVANAPGSRAAPQPSANTRSASNARLPSAGFARQGGAPANQKELANKQTQTQHRAQAQTNARATAPGAAATNRVQGQLPSSRFAQQTHGNAANARVQQERGKSQARVEPRGNANARTATTAAHTGGAAAQPRIPAASTRASERAQAQMNSRARTEINTPRPNPNVQAQQRAQAQVHAQDQARMQAQNRTAEARASAQQHAQAQAQARMSEQRTQQAQARTSAQHAQSQARVQQQQVQRAQVQTQHAPVQQRAQAQYREPPRPTSQPQSRPVQHAPQQRQEARRKDEKRDQNGGGG